MTTKRISKITIKRMTYIFDSRSGCRERLYLLSVLDNPNDIANWAYDPRRDVWDCADGRAKAVRWEAAESLKVLKQHRGIGRVTALEMVGYTAR